MRYLCKEKKTFQVIMRYILHFILTLFLLSGATEALAQSKTWQEMHKVKKKETIYGIARDYGITVDELKKANPEMYAEDYELKKGDYIRIPYPTASKSQTTPTTNVSQAKRSVRVGFMLPLHNVDGDGRRMVEYYRGFLLACEDMKKEGISIDIHAWNVPIDADINQTLAQNEASKCDVIFGPLYTRQVPALAAFTSQHNIKMVIPFSINGNEVDSYQNVYQVYQSSEELTTMSINCYLKRFNGYHTVFVNCNDATSDKGAFTYGLRKRLEELGRSFNITNIDNTNEQLVKAFSTSKNNVVILNTGRSPELNKMFTKLEAITSNNPNIKVSLFGYTDWLMYEKYDLDNFFKYDTYIPTHFYYNSVASKTQELETRYRKNFGTSMMEAKPRFALTGYDQATFFVKGIYQQGKSFTKTLSGWNAVQTNLKFEQAKTNGGMRNKHFMFVHYNRNKSISTVVY